MKETFLAIATIAVLGVGQGQAQEPASGPSPKVPELAALSGLVGKWDCRFQFMPLEGVTEGGRHGECGGGVDSWRSVPAPDLDHLGGRGGARTERLDDHDL